MRKKIIALDLEGTLVYSAENPLPRPGLKAFLLFCTQRFKRVVLFSAVDEHRAREVWRQLNRKKLIPLQLKEIEIVKWQGRYKDLRFVQRQVYEEVLLLEDNEYYVHPQQLEQWVPVKSWASPLATGDRELDFLIDHVERLLNGVKNKAPGNTKK